MTARLRASVLWLGREPLRAGRAYTLKLGSARVTARVGGVEHVLGTSTLGSSEANGSIGRNDLAECTLELDRPIAFDLAADSPEMGRFVLLEDFHIRGGGVVLEALSDPWAWVREHDSQAVAGLPAPRSRANGVVLWFTGLSGAGKTTIAERVVRELEAAGRAVEHLDGDTIRSLFPQTGFSREERDAHVRRVGFIASRLAKHGVCVVASLISPYEESRRFVRGLCESFVEIHVATPLEECERRDAKGLYARARRGEIRGFTGIDDPYEAPSAAEVTIDTRSSSVDDAWGVISKCLQEMAVIERESRGVSS